ncbi:YWFCY domain-containing protein [Parabacteroides distasonis]|nr:YWFCY domain-containing protein [Parabacteroides distasonis]
MAKVMEFMRAISIVFVVIHVYWFCYRAFVDAGINIGVVDKILLNFREDGGAFQQPAGDKSIRRHIPCPVMFGHEGREEPRR